MPRFTLIFPTLLLCLSGLPGQELPFQNPIAEPLGWGDLTLHLEKWLTFPPTSDAPPRTRINHIVPAADGSDRLWVNDLRGQLYFIKGDHITLYLNLRDHLPDFADERGLGGGFNFYCFHPEFSQNGLFYTVHSEEPGSIIPDFKGPAHRDNNSLESILVEWKCENPKADSFTGTHREILRVRFPLQIHTMQQIAFRPSAQRGDDDHGLLYVAIGEGGSVISKQSRNTGQLDSLLGTIIRIDPAGNNSTNGKYGIPAGNPYASDGKDGTLGEIWAYGFRNPHRFVWDALHGNRLLATDIGEHSIEEVNLIQPGHNYGWPHREGTFVFPLNKDTFGLSPLPKDDSGFTYPVAQFDHTEGGAIAGGYVYHGTDNPELQGLYIFGEIVHGHIFYTDAAQFKLGRQTPIKKFRLSYQGTKTTMPALVGNGRVDLRIGIDGGGELYLMEKATGSIYRITSVSKD